MSRLATEKHPPSAGNSLFINWRLPWLEIGMTQGGNRYKANDCINLRYLAEAFSIPEIALLWCGVIDDLEREELLSDCVQTGGSGIARGVYTHHYVPCLKLKTQLIARAMEEGKLRFSRDGGIDDYYNTTNHIAWERRTVRGAELKEFLIKFFPTEKPVFLFDEIERGAHEKISIETYQALEARNKVLESRLERIELEAKTSEADKELLEYKNNALNKQIDELKKQNENQSDHNPVDVRKEKTYLNVIAILLEIATGTAPSVKVLFESEEKLKNYISDKYTGYYGASKTNLNSLFPRARESFNKSM